MTRNAALVSWLAAAATMGAHAAQSRAGGLNDYTCRLDLHPRPVVLVHGRGGTVEGFVSILAALDVAGYCAYGVNYGQTDGQGPYGHDHLSVSGSQINAFIHHVLERTGADQVDLIGHSAGTGVIDNVILDKGAGPFIHRVVSFGGLHHPYAHAGAPGFLDATLFLPNLIETARLVDPDITAQDVIVLAIETYAALGGSLAGVDVETATSNFANDLFEPNYWRSLHGGLSEAPGTYIMIGAGRRSIPTNDSAPDVCYTNIVGVQDTLAGATAGFQDEAPNVENFTLTTSADHTTMLDDAIALEKMLAALEAPCEPAWPEDGGDEPDGDDPAFEPDAGVPGGDDPGEVIPPDDDPGGWTAGGCHVATPVPDSGAWPLLAITALVFLRRRRDNGARR